MDKLVEAVENKYIKKKSVNFRIGDTVKVHTKIMEEGKERVQTYNGLVMGKKGRGLSGTFTVGRVAFGYANEKIFPIHSPSIEVEVIRRGKVRKAKLTYLRGKVGKSAKVTGVFGEVGEVASNNAEETNA